MLKEVEIFDHCPFGAPFLKMKPNTIAQYLFNIYSVNKANVEHWMYCYVHKSKRNHYIIFMAPGLIQSNLGYIYLIYRPTTKQLRIKGLAQGNLDGTHVQTYTARQYCFITLVSLTVSTRFLSGERPNASNLRMRAPTQTKL